MKTEKILSTVLCGVLSLCIAVFGLLAALECTLFKEGYLARKMEKTGYITSMADAIRASCQGYAVDAGLNATATDQFFTEEDVKADIFLNMDARFRNVYSTIPTRFGSLVEYFENHIAWETDQQITDQQREQLVVLQASCERVYQEAVRPPFDAALSTLLQYRSIRKWGWIAFAVLAAASLALLARIDRSVRARGENLGVAVLGASLTLWLLAALLKWKTDYSSWMPQENLAQGLFCRWLEGFPAALALIGVLLIVVLLICVFCNSQKKRKTVAPEPKQSGRTINRTRAVQNAQKTPVKTVYRNPNQTSK